MLENEEFTGAWVRLPMGLFERIAVAAENHHQRLSQWVDMTTIDGTEAAISSWLDHLEQARTQPTPSAEPGDLLVKLKRGEFWTFTVHGWRELAPIELVAEQGRRQTVEFVHEPADREFLVGPSEAVRAGWSERDVDEPPKTRRFFGRSVVEDELDRIRGAQGAGVIPESGTIPMPWQPDERQQQLLDSLTLRDEELGDLIRATERLSGSPGLTEEYLAHLRGRQLEINEARLALRWLMERLYGRQGVA